MMEVVHTESDGRRRTLAEPLYVRFNNFQLDFYSNARIHVLREALERAEDQPFTLDELVYFKMVLAAECRYLKGSDIAWEKPANGDAPSVSRVNPSPTRRLSKSIGE